MKKYLIGAVFDFRDLQHGGIQLDIAPDDIFQVLEVSVARGNGALEGIGAHFELQELLALLQVSISRDVIT